MIRKRCGEKYESSADDDWEIDFEELEKNLNEKTKIFILNTPHNPIGKVFTPE